MHIYYNDETSWCRVCTVTPRIQLHGLCQVYPSVQSSCDLSINDSWLIFYIILITESVPSAHLYKAAAACQGSCQHIWVEQMSLNRGSPNWVFTIGVKGYFGWSSLGL